MKKLIIFDMDGTIADFYSVDNWLNYLLQENSFPYEIAEPMIDINIFIDLIKQCKLNGWEIAVTSWLSRNSTREYKAKVRQAKRNWLIKLGLFDLLDEVHLVQYGTPKQKCTKADIQILFDDDDKVRKSFTNEDKNRYTVNPLDTDIIEVLKKIIEKK